MLPFLLTAFLLASLPQESAPPAADPEASPVGTQGPPREGVPAPSEGAEALREAEALLARGEAERAVQVLEAARAARPADARLECALGEALERRVDGGAPWTLMEEARAAWDRALALAPDALAAQRGAIAVRLRLGQYEPALAMAERALGAAWLAGGATPPVLLELACRARLGALPAPEAPAARAAALAGAWGALQHARALAPDSVELVRLAAGLLESEGLVARALEELVTALAGPLGRTPAAGELHRALIELHQREGVEERLGPLFEGWNGAGTNATLAWSSAWAWRLVGDLALRERRFPAAEEAYARSGQWLGVAATLDPARRAEVESLRFLGALSSGWCALESGDLDAAGARLLPLLGPNLARREQPDGLGRTLAQALVALSERRVGRHEFEHAAREARAVVAELPEDGAWWRRLGAALRGQAAQIQAGTIADVPERARESRSREILREAWQAYQKAAERLGDDARVLGEAAALQVELLRDNLAEAETLLQRAIQLGEARLAELGEDAPEGLRLPCVQTLAEAYRTLGSLSYHVYRQPARARGAFERALAVDPEAEPEVASYLAALDGQRGPVPEPERGQDVEAPLAGNTPRARAWPAWEASLGEARERARREERGLLVYHRGLGLGREIARLDALVTTPEFVRLTAGAVLLVADAERLTFVERRHDGRRVSCPRFGTVTCGEHLAAEAEVAAWLAEAGAADEGLWWLPAGAERPERVRDLAQLGALAAPVSEATHVGEEPFEALEASLGGDGGASEARDLVATRSLGARLLVERILWEGFRSGQARGTLLAALAESKTPEARELLAAAARQGLDPELARASLAVWPAGLELEPVVHAWRWAVSPEVRAAAEVVLRRERPDDPLWSARAVLGAR